jgi:phospholipid/cholesterol/gamma-HCH transport system substrate-binding protein
MKEHTRNVMVGVTVIVAFGLLAAMILIFAGLPGMLQGGYEIKMRFPATADAHEGDPVHLAGIVIGSVTHIGFTDGDARKGVTFTARIDADKKIPGNANAYIFAKGIAGGAYVELKADGEERPTRFLPAGTIIDGTLKTSMLPDELQDGLKGISKLAKNLNDLLAPAQPASQPASQAATQGARTRPATPQGLKGTVAKLNRTLDALNEVLSKENRANLAASLNNVNDLTRNLLTTAEKLSSALDSVNRTVTKIESGKGSAGKLINDPELYNNLLEASQQLSQALKEFRQLLSHWKEKGVGIKLK